jgi:hypothetical protein
MSVFVLGVVNQSREGVANMPSEIEIAKARLAVLEAERAAEIGAANPAPAAPATSSELAPGQAYAQQEEARPAQIPADVMTLEEIAAWENRPAPKSGAEQREHLAQLDAVLASVQYHEEQS